MLHVDQCFIFEFFEIGQVGIGSQIVFIIGLDPLLHSLALRYFVDGFDLQVLRIDWDKTQIVSNSPQDVGLPRQQLNIVIEVLAVPLEFFLFLLGDLVLLQPFGIDRITVKQLLFQIPLHVDEHVGSRT